MFSLVSSRLCVHCLLTERREEQELTLYTVCALGQGRSEIRKNCDFLKHCYVSWPFLDCSIIDLLQGELQSSWERIGKDEAGRLVNSPHVGIHHQASSLTVAVYVQSLGEGTVTQTFKRTKTHTLRRDASIFRRTRGVLQVCQEDSGLMENAAFLPPL